MKYFPKLEREEKYINSYMKYDTDKIQIIVYAYLVLGMSHMSIENHIMHISGRGYECMHILHYLGIKPKHKAIFKAVPLQDIKKSLLESSDDVGIILDVFEDVDNNSLVQDFEEITRTCVHKIKEHFVERDVSSASFKDLEAYYNSEMKMRNPRVQNKFRSELIKEFGGKCALCSISAKGLLVASHILPYSRCNGELKHAGNKNNGLLLCVLHDALFESGEYVSFDTNGNIMVKDSIPVELYDDLKISKKSKIPMKYLNDDRKKYLEKHNLMFSIDDKG